MQSIRWKRRVNYLADEDVVTVSTAQFHLDSVHQPLQLLPHVTRPPHRAKLDKVFKTPLSGITALHPLQQRERDCGRDKERKKRERESLYVLKCVVML